MSKHPTPSLPGASLSIGPNPRVPTVNNRLVRPPFPVDGLWAMDAEADFAPAMTTAELDAAAAANAGKKWPKPAVLPAATLAEQEEAEPPPGTLHEMAYSAHRRALALRVRPVPGKKLSKTPELFLGTYTSEPIETEFRFTELMPSWNLWHHDGSQGYAVLVRVSAEAEGEPWSPWFVIGEGGIHLPNTKLAEAGEQVIGWEDAAPAEWGQVRVDYFEAAEPWGAFQMRVVLGSFSRRAPGQGNAPCLKRLYVAYAGPGNDAELYADLHGDEEREHALTAAWGHQLAVPYRSQKDVAERDWRDHICQPTSVAMVLEYYDVRRPTAALCKEIFHEQFKAWGVWPNATQAASRYGFAALVRRFRAHRQVEETLLAGTPVIASIRVEPGELPVVDYPRTSGHLVVILGLTESGDYLVNDPYSRGPRSGATVYPRAALETTWLARSGVGMLIERPEITPEDYMAEFGSAGRYAPQAGANEDEEGSDDDEN